MRALLPAPATLVGYWKGSDAAFAAVRVPEKGVESVVALGSGGTTKIRFSTADDGRISGAGGRKVESLDLEGLEIPGGWVVLFNTESRMAGSVLSFDTGKGSGTRRFVVTGLAPGSWDIWRDGWLIDIGVQVEPSEGVLYFEGRPGSYFLRRTS